MKLNVFGKWLQVVAICFLVGSCQQFPVELLTETEKGTLKVKTRSARFCLAKAAEEKVSRNW